MSRSLLPSEMTPEQLRSFLAEERENGFLHLDQDGRLFAIEFTRCGSVPEAADAVKISRERAKRMIRDPLVRNFINYLNQQKEHYSLIDASFIETQYLELLAMVLGKEDVAMVNKDGMTFTARAFDGNVARGVLQDLAKISGNFKDDPSVVINQNNVNLSDSQKAALDKLLDADY